MQTRCPNCGTDVEVDDFDEMGSVDCQSCGSTFEPAQDETVEYTEPIPSKIAHFELLEQTGHGAFGTVWRAQDTKLERSVAVKIPRNDQLTPQELDRFLREARAAAQLKHPNIVAVHQAGRTGNTVYIVSDFVHGVTLSQWLSAHHPTPQQTAQLCAKLADAVHHAHQAGVVHRDIKPSNVMIDDQQEPYIMDFGLAKRDAGDATISVEGYVMGTPAYMSPEQAGGKSHEADRRSDVYSLGVILFQLLTGDKPFRGTEEMILRQVIESDAPHPRKLDGRVPQDLDTICLKCLEKQPQNRYATAEELAEELRRYSRGEPIMARPITRTMRVWRWCQRNPLAAVLSAALAVTLMLGMMVVTTLWLRANRHATDAAAAAEESRWAAGREKQAHHRTEQYLYVAHMNMAQQAYESNDPNRIVSILNQHGPSDPSGDFRSFEWYYWWHQTHRWSSSLDHGAAINAVALSTDGRTIATAGSDNTIVLWDIVSGQPRRTLRGHEAAVFCLAFSPQGQTLVSSGQDKTIRFWDIDSGAEQAQLDAGASVFALKFSDDGQTLVSAGADLLVRLWDAPTHQHRQSLEGHFDFVYSIAMSPDGSRLASGGLDRTVRIWDARTGELQRTLHGHALEVWAVALSPDGSTLASGSADHTIKLWNVDTGRLKVTLDAHDDRVRSLVFSPDGKTLASAGQDRAIKLWDMTARSQSLQVPYRDVQREGVPFFERMRLPNDDFLKDALIGHAQPVVSLAYSGNGKTLISASQDGLALLWNVIDLEEKSVVRAHRKTINSLAISGDGRVMLSGGNDRTARFWDVAALEPLGQPLQHEGPVLAVALSPNGKLFATACYDGAVRLGSLAGREPTLLEGHETAASAVAFSPDNMQLASAGHDGTVRIWDVQTGQPRLNYTGHEGRVQAVVFLPGGTLVATAGADRTIQIWKTDSGQLVRTLEGHQGMVWSLALSPDGSQLASASADETVMLWNTQDGQILRTFRGHAQTVRCVAFCPDGRTIASGGDDKTIKLWDIATGEPKTRLEGHKFRVWSVAFTPDGGTLLSGSLAIRIWHGAEVE